VAVVSIERIEVGGGVLRARVRVGEGAPLRTAAITGLAEAALGLLPGLRRHTCDNDDGRDFARELRDTETAHLLEHVACELMALAGSPRSLRGETSWDFSRDGRGVYRVALQFDDDLVAMGALREAAVIVEWLLDGAPAEVRPGVGEAVRRLSELRSRD
jgi:hypothetical protein